MHLLFPITLARRLSKMSSTSFWLFSLLVWTFCSSGVASFDLPAPKAPSKTAINDYSRRIFFRSAVGAATGLFFVKAANAAPSQEAIDKANILKGYDRLTYLLDNWERETTICAIGGDNLEKRCERTPLKVMDYMGFRSTNDPLFKADKAMMRLFTLAPGNRDADYVEAVEKFAENAEEASGMAYISSWGEANPGGGKDRVQLFIERARKNVETSRDSLGVVIEILDLKK